MGIFNVQVKPSQKEFFSRAYNMYLQEEEVDHSPTQAWTLEELKEKQWADANLRPIINYLKVPSELNKGKVNPNIKDLSSYFLDPTDILFKEIQDPRAELRTAEEVIVIPYSLQKQATSIIHDTVLGGHAATERTVWAAKRRFFWRVMNTYINRYVRNCKVCQLNKGNTHKKLALT